MLVVRDPTVVPANLGNVVLADRVAEAREARVAEVRVAEARVDRDADVRDNAETIVGPNPICTKT